MNKPSLPGTPFIHYGQHLTLYPEKAVYWKEERCLLLSDLHLGKATHFRKAGIPVPGQVLYHDLERLGSLIEQSQAEKIIFLGDLFHSELNMEWTTFVNWLNIHPEREFILIKGNHDILPEQAYKLSRLQIIEEKLALPPFLLTHEPLIAKKEKTDLYNICGHIHPAVSLKGAGFQRLTLPCFYFGLHYAILPAFGKFTGFYKIKPGLEEIVFVITSERVLRV